MKETTTCIFRCPIDNSLQPIDYIIFNPNIILIGCSKCGNQFKFDSTWTATQTTSADNTTIKRANTSTTKVLV